MDTLIQFYPTPPNLALKAWRKFENKNITRLLEPSAGSGDLVAALIAENQSFLDKGIRHFKEKRDVPYLSQHTTWEAIELNPEFHPLLREKKAKVIGYDFLSFQHGAVYSHIIMNPPFAQGVHHVLHAWDILFNGEIVAIINAETIRNPYSKERQFLVDLITEHGSIEYVQDAFISEDAQRKTPVEVALIHLKKEASSNHLLLDYLQNLARKESESGQALQGASELTLPNNFIQNSVINYNLAIKANLEAQIALEKAKAYHSRLSPSKNAITSEIDPLEQSAQQSVKSLLEEDYNQIHKDAWQMIISSSIVTSKLSSETAKEVESQLKVIYDLAFNTTNIYGFLAGLAQQRGEIQKSMLLEVFDLITRYHSSNTCYYLGWKSNDEHRTVGKSIKMSRFILPLYYHSSRYDSSKKLQDIESTFLYLDGKVEPVVSLVETFRQSETFDRLLNGERLTTDYFDIRYYGKRSTMHFYPKRADLIQRLNVFAGKARQWLPEDMSQAEKGFVTQFEKAEKISSHFDLSKELKTSGDGDLNHKFNEGDAPTRRAIANILMATQEQLGITHHLDYQSALLLT